MALARTGLRPIGIGLGIGLGIGSGARMSLPAQASARTVFVQARTASWSCMPSVRSRVGMPLLAPPPSHVLRALSTSACSSSPAAAPERGAPPQPERKKPITQAVATMHAAKHGAAGPALSEDILTIPNALTASRLVMVPIIGWMILQGHMLPAAGLLFAAGLTDVLDGWIARRTGRLTVFGSIADPAADKGLMATMVITLGMSGLLPLPLVALILARDIGLVLSAFVIRYRTLPPPKTVARYFDPSLPSVMAKPTQLSKYNTFLQLLLVGLATILPAMEQATQAASAAGIHLDHPALTTLFHALSTAFGPFQWIVAATTAISGLQYLTGAGVSRVASASASTLARSGRNARPHTPPPKPPAGPGKPSA